VIEITRISRALIKRQEPKCIWFTGLSGAGKSTIANLLEIRLHEMGRHTYLLDGDILRQGINIDLGFTEADRTENIRRVAQVAKLMVDAGLIVLVATISPLEKDREFARSLFNQGEFLEVFVDTSIQECERRDTKGLYKMARLGTLKLFTGISSPYEIPTNPELHLPCDQLATHQAVERLMLTIKL
jgi:bifunctional enzyme CysN/CysC